MSVSVWLPRLVRLAFWLRAERLWRFLPGPASTLPVPVILNRFLTEDLVFSLGICGLLRSKSRHEGRTAPSTMVAAGHAHFRPGRANKPRPIEAASGGSKV